MPRQVADAFWSCDYCGMGGFRSFDEAKAHEVQECQQQQPRKRQRPFRCFLLLDPDGPPPRELSIPDVIACRSLEVFETEDSGAAYAGQVGIRCIHCSNNPTPPMAAVFPGSVDTIGSSVRMVAERHLQGCSMAPTHVREGVTSSSPRNNQALMDYCIDFCRRCGIVDRMPYKTGIVFEQPQQQQAPPRMEDTITATPLARRSKDFGEGQYVASYPQQPSQYGGQQQQQGMYAQEEVGGASTATSTPGHAATAPQQGTPHQPLTEASPHQGTYGMPPSQPSPYEGQQQQQPPPAPYPFYQDHTGAWVCRYCISIHPQYRDPGSAWSTPHRTPPPGNFIDQHLSLCRSYNQSMQQQQHPPPPMGWGGGQPQPPPHYPPYQPGIAPPPQYGGPPPQGWGTGASTPVHPQGIPPHYQAPTPEQGIPYYPPPDAPLHQGMIPPPVEGMDRPGTMAPQPATPRTPAPPSEAATRAAIEHLVASGRRFPPDPNVTEQLVIDEDKLLLTDYFYYLMKQLKLCRFSEADRKTRGGKRENVMVGYGGLQCIHCADAPNSRKFFWSSVDRLANSFAEIPGHVLKCRRCPNPTKAALAELKLRHPEQMSRLPRGSQKVFFRRMWRRLHKGDPNPEGEEKPAAEASSPEESKASTSSSSKVEVAEGNDSSPNTSSDDSTAVVQRATEDAAKALAASTQSSAPLSSSNRILLAIVEDKEWLSDMDCFIRKQLEVFCANDDDRLLAQTDRKYPVNLGQVGIRCIHCALSKGARGNAVAFPYSISGVYESVREFQRLHLESCPNLPNSAKDKLAGFKGSASLSSVLRKYYVLASKALGLYDTPDGIRAGAESVPLGSSAAFAFSESTGGSSKGAGNVSEQMRSSERPFMESGPMITPLESRKRKNPPLSAEQASRKMKEEEEESSEDKRSS